MSLFRDEPKEDAPVTDAATKSASLSFEVLDISPEGIAAISA